MGYTLGEASREVGKSKSTLSKAVKSGKISATKLDDGSFSIEPVELFRVFPRVNSSTVENERSRTPDETHENGVQVQLLEAELKHAREMIAELREDRDLWRTQASRLLAAPPVEAQKSWIHRFFRKI
jgi:hypothetical protein